MIWEVVIWESLKLSVVVKRQEEEALVDLLLVVALLLVLPTRISWRVISGHFLRRSYLRSHVVKSLIVVVSMVTFGCSFFAYRLSGFGIGVKLHGSRSCLFHPQGSGLYKAETVIRKSTVSSVQASSDERLARTAYTPSLNHFEATDHRVSNLTTHHHHLQLGQVDKL